MLILVCNMIYISKFIFFTLIYLLSGQLQAQQTNDKILAEFSGFMWREKVSKDAVGPGGNFFGLSNKNVQFKRNGSLVLKLKKKNYNWSCSEVVCNTDMGFGTYTFVIEADSSKLDKNTVIGLFLYNEHLPPLFNEVDIEMSKWGGTTTPNTQYVVFNDSIAPWKHRFLTTKEMQCTIQKVTYTPDSICFSSYYSPKKRFTNRVKYQQKTFYNNEYAIDPKVRMRINLWLVDGQPPKKRQQKVIIRKVKYTPLK